MFSGNWKNRHALAMQYLQHILFLQQQLLKKWIFLEETVPTGQVPVVWRLDNSIHWINRYPVDTCWQKKNHVICWIVIHPLDSVIHLSNNQGQFFTLISIAQRHKTNCYSLDGMFDHQRLPIPHPTPQVAAAVCQHPYYSKVMKSTLRFQCLAQEQSLL